MPVTMKQMSALEQFGGMCSYLEEQLYNFPICLLCALTRRADVLRVAAARRAKPDQPNPGRKSRRINGRISWDMQWISEGSVFGYSWISNRISLLISKDI